jgi:hypothetical protein
MYELLLRFLTLKGLFMFIGILFIRNSGGIDKDGFKWSGFITYLIGMVFLLYTILKGGI